MIIFVADFPMPHHGMSAINQALYTKLINDNLKCTKINSNPSFIYKHFGVFFKALFRPFHHVICCLCLFFLLAFNSNRVLYRSINGGLGQVYDIFYLGLARFFRCPIFIHHHSFSYLNNKSILFDLLLRVSGSDASHIVLGEEMKERLVKLYCFDSSKVRIVSNLAFQQLSNDSVEIPNDVINIGHLANLTAEKGVLDFLRVVKESSHFCVLNKALLGGPCNDEVISSEIEMVKLKNNQLEYYGAVYGQDKSNFFSRVNVFFFPSKYDNEAEPLVLYEAAANGSLLVVTDRGCMKSVSEAFQGIVLDECSDVVTKFLDLLRSGTILNMVDFDSVQYRKKLYKEKYLETSIALDRLITDLRLSGEVSRIR